MRSKSLPIYSSARCRVAAAAPNHNAAAEKTSPRCKPARSLPVPDPSAIQPTTVGPMICPAANTMVKALMPAAHWLCCRLWRTSAVVLATTDKNTPPNSSPDSNTNGHMAVSAGSTQAMPSSKFSIASACPPLKWSISLQAHTYLGKPQPFHRAAQTISMTLAWEAR